MRGGVFQFSPWLSSVRLFSCPFLGVLTRVWSGLPLPGLTSLVWSLLAPRSWKPPSLSTPFARSIVLWRWCSADCSLPLVSSLIAARFGLWPYGLAIAALPLVSRPWTGLCWFHLLSLSLGVLFVVIPRQLVGSGVHSPASPIALLLAF